MLENKNDVFEQIKDELPQHEITNEDQFTDAIYEITDNMVDIYTADLFDSVEFLYEQGLLDEVHGDLLQAIRGAQYEYFQDVVAEHYNQLYDSVLENEEDENNEA